MCSGDEFGFVHRICRWVCLPKTLSREETLAVNAVSEWNRISPANQLAGMRACRTRKPLDCHPLNLPHILLESSCHCFRIAYYLFIMLFRRDNDQSSLEAIQSNGEHGQIHKYRTHFIEIHFIFARIQTCISFSFHEWISFRSWTWTPWIRLPIRQVLRAIFGQCSIGRMIDRIRIRLFAVENPQSSNRPHWTGSHDIPRDRIRTRLSYSHPEIRLAIRQRSIQLHVPEREFHLRRNLCKKSAYDKYFSSITIFKLASFNAPSAVFQLHAKIHKVAEIVSVFVHNVGFCLVSQREAQKKEHQVNWQ